MSRCFLVDTHCWLWWHIEVYIPSRLQASHMTTLPVLLEHAMRVTRLPRHHRDPFDRLLVAQAQVEDVTLITADEQLRRYDVTILMAV